MSERGEFEMSADTSLAVPRDMEPASVLQTQQCGAQNTAWCAVAPARVTTTCGLTNGGCADLAGFYGFAPWAHRS